MKKVLLLILLSAIFMTGCANNSSFNKYMDQGKEAIINQDYTMASDYLQLALEKKPKNEEAKSLSNQIIKLQEAIKLFESKNYEKTIEKCKEIEDTKSENNLVKDRAKKLLTESNEKLQEVEKEKEMVLGKISEIEN